MRDRSGQPMLSEALIDVAQTRIRAITGGPRPGEATAGALSDQIAYDVALIRYGRCLGIACRPTDFDPPTLGRQVIERRVAERGVIPP